MTDLLITRPLRRARRSFAGATRILAHRQARYAIYQTIATGLLLTAVCARGYQTWRSGEPINFIVSDARGYYVYLPSLVVDGDLDLRNQMLATFGRDLERIDYDVNDVTATGVVSNKYPIGTALTLSPAFLLAHGTALLGHALSGGESFAPDGYSPPYQLFCLAMILVLSACTMLLLDRLMERYLRLGGAPIAAAVITFWLGSHYAWYCFREPFMVHVISTFWVTLVVFACARLRFGFRAGAPQSTRRRDDIRLLLPVLALATSMALVCRPTNVFLAPFIAWALAGVARAGAGTRILRALPVALAAGLLPLAAQAAVWRAIHGSWLHYSYGGERFVWTQPALIQTLFGWHKGIFIWSPLLFAAAAGLLLAFRHASARPRREIVACWLAGAAILWYLNSAWWCWGFGWSFGARAFLELAGMFVLGLALLFEWLRRQSLPAQKLAALALMALVGYNYVLMGLYQIHWIDRGDWQTGGWSRAGAPASFLEHVEKQRHARLEAGEP